MLYTINCNIQNGIAVDKSATSRRAAVRTSNAIGKIVTSDPLGVKRKSDWDIGAEKVVQA